MTPLPPLVPAFGRAYTLGVPSPKGHYQPTPTSDPTLALRSLNVLEPGQPASVYKDPEGFLVGVTGPERDLLLTAKTLRTQANNTGDGFIRQAAHEASANLKRAVSVNAQMVDVSDVVANPDAFPIEGGVGNAHVVNPDGREFIPPSAKAAKADTTKPDVTTQQPDASLSQQAQHLADELTRQLKQFFGDDADIKVKTSFVQATSDSLTPPSTDPSMTPVGKVPPSAAQPPTSPFDAPFGPAGPPNTNAFRSATMSPMPQPALAKAKPQA
jgi:hypothetical protein